MITFRHTHTHARTHSRLYTNQQIKLKIQCQICNKAEPEHWTVNTEAVNAEQNFNENFYFYGVERVR